MKGKLLTVVLSLIVLSVAANISYGWIPPVAVLDAEPEYVILGKSVTLDGSGSYSHIVKYEWDFDGDTTYDYTETSSCYPDGAFDGITTHIYSGTGDYTVKLRVTKINDLTATDTCMVYVSEDLDIGGGDDLPDGWETEYLGGTNYGADDDPDDDDCTNLCEYLHGTDPGDGDDEPSSAITIYVPYNASTIQRAINACIDYEIIEVEPGRYVENLYSKNKEITLTSTDPEDPAVVARTIIDGSGDANNVIVFESGDANPTITGFTITNGYANSAPAVGAYSDQGGGIYCNGVSPTISNCVITKNKASNDNDPSGGGIYCSGGSPTIINCVITENAAYYSGGTPCGGGIHCNGGSPTIANCVITKNEADINGGGIYCTNISASTATITNCIFLENQAFYGGGMYNNNSSPKLVNCVFTNNTGYFGGGIGNDSTSSKPNLTNCILWANGGTSEDDQIYGGDPTVSYCCIQGLDDFKEGEGNIGDDSGEEPCFVNASDPDGPDDIWGTADDGLVLSVTESPCIDKGDDSAPYLPDYDIIGNDRTMDGDHIGDSDVDMGPYEVPKIWFVDASATGSNNGKSWTDARTDLQDALTTDAAADDEIWVAAAEQPYKPHASSRSVSFELIEDVGVYGGFGGTDRGGHCDSKWTTYKTILSGDITGDNSYHVVKVPDGADGAALDGFVITGGNADGSGDDSDGAGIYCDSVSFTLSNCAIVENKATSSGGGMYCEDSSVAVSNCVFADNTGDAGAGVYNTRSSASAESYLVFINCVFSENEADNVGGGIFFAPPKPIFAELISCTFYGNDAYQGGGMANAVCNMPVTNCIFWGNTASDDGNQICTYYECDVWKPSFSHCDIQDCGDSGEYWDSDLGADGGENIEDDPEFDNTGDLDGTQVAYVKNDVDTAVFSGVLRIGWMYLTGDPYSDWLDGHMDEIRITHANIFYASPKSDKSDSFEVPTAEHTLVDCDGLDNTWATADDGLMLDRDSACINAADYYATPRTDITGRFWTDANCPEIGAYASKYKIIVVMCWIDESRTVYYPSGTGQYNSDSGGYEDLVADLWESHIVKSGCMVPACGVPNCPETGCTGTMADVMPNGSSPPDNISVTECSRPLEDVDEFIADFNRIREDLVPVPDCVILLADASGSLGGFNGYVLGDGYPDFEDWLKDWLKSYGLDPRNNKVFRKKTFTDPLFERWIAAITTEIKDVLGLE